ncbi:hypothetical protein DERP_014516, partial [Dermatophagoides pteronyssinus]
QTSSSSKKTLIFFQS